MFCDLFTSSVFLNADWPWRAGDIVLKDNL
jgi:hypothetical protein